MDSPKSNVDNITNASLETLFPATTTTVANNTSSTLSKEDLSAMVPFKAEAKRQWKKENKAPSSADAEEKQPEVVDQPEGVPLESFHAAPSIRNKEGEENNNHSNIVIHADVRPGAVRVLGIDQLQRTLDEEEGARGEGHEEGGDMGNAQEIPGGVVAEVLDDDQLYNEFRHRHDVVEAEKVVPFSKARPRWITLAAIIVIVIIAAVITTVLVLKKSNPSLPSTLPQVPTTAPSESPTWSHRPTAAPSVSRMNAIRSTLLNHSVSSKASLFDENTNQYRSLVWLTNRDHFRLDDGAHLESIIDRYVLALFYYSTNGVDWLDHVGFLSKNSSICNWNKLVDGFGRVGCFCNMTLNVFYLVFEENGLLGTIPTELGKLSRLAALYLYSDQLLGNIPTELGQLSSLNFLYLDGNKLSGSVPSELGQLSGLKDLSLANNRLWGFIPTELGKLPSLNYLHLTDNDLSSNIPTELGNLSNLTELRLAINTLNGFIPTELGKLSHLHSLDLKENRLQGRIPTELGQLFSLTELYLSNNHLTGSIPTKLGHLSGLYTLDLGKIEKWVACCYFCLAHYYATTQWLVACILLWLYLPLQPPTNFMEQFRPSWGNFLVSTPCTLLATNSQEQFKWSQSFAIEQYSMKALRLIVVLTVAAAQTAFEHKCLDLDVEHLVT